MPSEAAEELAYLERVDAQEMLALTSDVDVDRELAARSFREYVEIAWPFVEPAKEFQPNWHIDAICEHLEAVTAGEILRLVVNMPPTSGKSLLISVLWPSWLWAKRPGTKLISASYAPEIVKRDCLRARTLGRGRPVRRWSTSSSGCRRFWGAGG